MRVGAGKKGQALSEFALLLPLLLLLLLGLIELSLLLYAHVQVSSAVREAARAGSLYRSTRYSDLLNLSNPAECQRGISGWTLEQRMRQAVVQRQLDGDGCRDPAGTIGYSALGNLEPEPAEPDWTIVITDTQFLPQSGSVMPQAGSRATVTLSYPYRPLLLADLFPLPDPIWIRKSLEFEYQQ